MLITRISDVLSLVCRPIEHQKLLPHQAALNDNSPRTAKPQNSSVRPQEVREKYQCIFHDGGG